jgi:SAM-dependent methyltransferase
MSSPDPTANAEQIAYWNEVSGAKWVRLGDQIDSMISPAGLRGLGAAQISPGERVLDVGCGCGQTTLQIAERVENNGSVLGVDISVPMLERARMRAREGDAPNVAFEAADAQTRTFESPLFDLIFSRFGVMFFGDPVQAFANLRSALLPDGRLTFVCWQEVPKNPWMLVPVAAAAQHLELPPPAPPGSPGPFAFADSEHVRGILDSAGFGDIHCESLTGQLGLAGSASLAEAADFVIQMGPTGNAMREATDDTQARVRAAVLEALAPHETERGVWLDYASWIFTAHR